MIGTNFGHKFEALNNNSSYGYFSYVFSSF